MKKVITVMIMVFSIVTLVGCGSATNNTPPAESSATDTATVQKTENRILKDSSDSSSENSTSDSGSKILVAYFSRAGENYNVGTVEKGNTQIMAEMIAEETGGTLFKVETVTPYPSSYDECTDVAKQEQNDNARPELKEAVDDFDDYDTIILGFPIWWGDMPMAMYTFLESYDFSGKTVLPFNTHEGSGEAGTTGKIQSALPQATALEGLAVQGKTAQEDRNDTMTTIQKWLSQNEIN
ncbi:MAG: flavodoxin [Lachnospiraceae bacterium]|nr:flavodoxin [Lachnospiraceae bacterium]